MAKLPSLIKNLVNALSEPLGVEFRRRPYQLRTGFEFSIANLLAMELLDGSEAGLIQIGANDGRTDDPLHSLIMASGVKGILVEPQPEAFRRLQDTYAGRTGLVLVNAAVAHHNGTQSLFRVDPEMAIGLPADQRAWVDQIASFDRRLVVDHLRASFADAETMVTAVEVRTLTFESLVTDFGGGDFQALQIDAEGFDFEILKMALRLGYRPKYIGYEFVHLSQADRRASWRKLEELGYSLNLQSINTIAWRR